MRLEIARPVRRETTRITAGAQLYRAFEMPEFDAEARQSGEGVDDEPTAVAGVVIALVGIRFRLDRAVDADGVTHHLVFRSGVGSTGIRTGRRHTGRTSDECLLGYEFGSLASIAAVHPLWTTASCSIDSNAILLGS